LIIGFVIGVAQVIGIQVIAEAKTSQSLKRMNMNGLLSNVWYLARIPLRGTCEATFGWNPTPLSGFTGTTQLLSAKFKPIDHCRG
jgi:hypothetical protein